MSKVTIGNYTAPHGLFLAPLAGVSDRAFRHVCRAAGAEYTFSEMVSAKALCYEQKSKKVLKTAPLASVYSEEMPLAIQLFGCEPDFMAEAARLIAECAYKGCTSDTPPAAIDINMGCPVHKVVSNGEGSALLKNPALAADVVRAVKKAIPLPVTVKIRIGWDTNLLNAVEVAQAIEEAGASAIAVHGRTRMQMYAPGVNREMIAKVKDAVKIPVIGNGDIYSAEDAITMLRETGCDGVMIARGALGNPWIFSEIRAALDGDTFTPPTLAERLNTALFQVEHMIKEKGERVAIAEARKQVSWYIKGINGAATARDEINKTTSFEEMKSILSHLI